jgi:hypothetical protein
MKDERSLPLREQIESDGAQGVAICFQDIEIGTLFLELLSARGIPAEIVNNPAEVPTSRKVLTEPRYHSALNAEHQAQCLIVGPRSTLRGIRSRCLEQPLTEEGVEAAISFLSGHSS